MPAMNEARLPVSVIRFRPPIVSCGSSAGNVLAIGSGIHGQRSFTPFASEHCIEGLGISPSRITKANAQGNCVADTFVLDFNRPALHRLKPPIPRESVPENSAPPEARRFPVLNLIAWTLLGHPAILLGTSAITSEERRRAG